MKRLKIFVTIIILILGASLASAENYKIIKKITVPYSCEVGGLVISPDGSKVAYMAGKGEKEVFIMVDDQKVSPEIYCFVWDLTFSPDGSKVVYWAQKGEVELIIGKGFFLGKGFVMINDKPVSPEFDGVGAPIFSPDGSKVAYIATKYLAGTVIYHSVKTPELRAKKLYAGYVMVNDKRVSPEFDGVGVPTFSPDGSKVAYRATKDEKVFVMVNDKKVSPEFDNIVFAEARFNKTGEIFFAGYDQYQHEILLATSLVEVN
jgi:WD40 repeat protein